jgi:tetratricopeptide (TPR) repeat protein
MRTCLILALLMSTWSASAFAQSRPDQPRTELDQLLTALPMAPNEETASRMESRIAMLWLKSGGPAVGLLLSHGTRNLENKEADEALQDFDAALALEPNLAEAYGRRALARYQAGDVTGAVQDLEETLRREPRHFGAWRTLSSIAEAQGHYAGALAAWKKLLEVDPKTPDGAKHLKELTRLAEGDDS